MTAKAGLESHFLWQYFHDWQEGQWRLPEGMPSTSHNSWKGRQYFSCFDVLSHFRLNSLVQFDISEKSALGFGFQLSILELFQSFLADFAVLSHCVELQMLEVVVVSFEGTESYWKFHWDIGL
jgi:hypothetical protein